MGTHLFSRSESKRGRLPWSAMFLKVSWLLAFLLFAAVLLPQSSPAATAHKHRKKRRAAAKHTATKTRAAVLHSSKKRLKKSSYRRRRHRKIFFNPWTEPTYADSTVGDSVDGEDLVIRKAAVDALGPFNGSIVVADPRTGRVLSVVNQKLAFQGAFQPCSTVKMVVSLASLTEGIVDSKTLLHLTKRYSMNMTTALARSNNLYFAKLGKELGFARVSKYAKLYGLGEKAGLNIPGEEAGFLTSEVPRTGVGMMTSFGDGIRITPLELASIVSTIANGGTMYYLQYPKSEEEVKSFTPRVKRNLAITDFIPKLKAGMSGAVEFGTARRASYVSDEPILGKTGTCTDSEQPGVHLGWFGSFNDTGTHKLVVIVLLTGGRGISGPIASGIAGNVYRNLSDRHYFTTEPQTQQASGSEAVQTSLISFPD